MNRMLACLAVGLMLVGCSPVRKSNLESRFRAKLTELLRGPMKPKMREAVEEALHSRLSVILLGREEIEYRSTNAETKHNSLLLGTKEALSGLDGGYGISHHLHASGGYVIGAIADEHGRIRVVTASLVFL